jgi:hypothetical protein
MADIDSGIFVNLYTGKSLLNKHQCSIPII